MLKLLEWFKLDKAALVNHMDVGVIRLKDRMRKKAERREKFRKDVGCKFNQSSREEGVFGKN